MKIDDNLRAAIRATCKMSQRPNREITAASCKEAVVKFLAKEIEVTHILIDVPVEYGEEDISNDFPLRIKMPQTHPRLTADRWVALVNIDTGKIVDWPADAGAQEISMNVCDRGTYVLYSNEEKVATLVEEYVPNAVIPGEWGDYIELKIAADGTITNWPKKPDVSAFFDEA